MKRIYIAVAFIAIVLCVSSAESGYITAKADMFTNKITKADKLMQKSDYDEALLLCTKTEQEWYESASIIDMLLIHDYVDNIGISISKMTSYAKNKDISMYYSESTQAKKQLASIKESEYPLIENIL